MHLCVYIYEVGISLWLYDLKIKSSFQLHLISLLRLDNYVIFFTVFLITHTTGGGFANSCNLYLDSSKVHPPKPIDVLR